MKHKITRDDFCIICFASSYIFAMMHIYYIWFKVISHHTRRVTHPWKNTTPTLWYLRGKCPFWLIWPIVIYWKAFLVRSRHILVSFYVCETTRCASDELLERAKLNQSFYIRTPRATGAQRSSPAGSECSCNRPGQAFPRDHYWSFQNVTLPF